MKNIIKPMLRVIISSLVSITLMMGAVSIALIIRQLLFNFTDCPEHILRAISPAIFIFIVYFCSKFTRIE